MRRIRARDGVYYYRAKVPIDLRELLGKREFSYSLRTKDAGLARELALEMSARQLRLCRVIRHADGMLTHEELNQLVARYMEMFAENREEDLVNSGKFSPDRAVRFRSNVLEDLQEAERAYVENDIESLSHLVQTVMWANDIRPDQRDVDRLCHRLLKVRVDLCREEAKRVVPANLGGVSADIKQEKTAAENSALLSILISEYLIYRDTSRPLRPKTRTELNAASAAMLSLMGDKPLAVYRNRDAQDFAHKLAQLPARWRQDFRGKTAADVLKITEGKALRRIEPATFNKEIGLIKAFWRWACMREERPTNPMDAVEPLDVGNVRDKM